MRGGALFKGKEGRGDFRKISFFNDKEGRDDLEITPFCILFHLLGMDDILCEQGQPINY